MYYFGAKIQEGKNIKKSLKIVSVVIALFFLVLTGSYLVFQSHLVQKKIISAITGVVTGSTNADFTIGHVDIVLFRKVVLEKVYISDQNKDTLAYVDRMVAKIDSISFKQKRLHIRNIKLEKPNLFISKDSIKGYNFQFLLPDSTSPLDWKIFCKNFDIRDGRYSYSDLNKPLKQKWEIKGFDVVINNFQLLSAPNFSCSLRKMNFTGKKGVSVREMQAEVYYRDSVIQVEALKGSTPHSKIDAPKLCVDLRKYMKTNKPELINVEAELNKLDLCFSDLSFIFPEFRDFNINAEMSGTISGRIDDLKGKNIKVSIGDLTHISGEFYLNGLPDLARTYIFINLNESYANLSAIREMYLPPKLRELTSKIPSFLQNVGTFSYKGNFTGFYNNFVAYGNFYSNLGDIQCDALFKPDHSNSLAINGHIKTNELDLGKILQDERLGTLNLSGDVNGLIESNKEYNILFKGNISKVGINKYNYQNISLDGKIEHNRFEGKLAIDDPNLRLNYFGEFDVTPNQPMFKFTANVKKANIGNLNLYSDKKASTSFDLVANFTGKNIDELLGKIDLENIRFRNATDSLFLDKAELHTSGKADSHKLVLESSWVDAEIIGQYNLMNIGSSVNQYFSSFLPSSIKYARKPIKESNDFSFTFTIKDANPLAQFLKPELDIKTPIKLTGYYRPNKKESSIEGEIPYISYKGRKFEKIKVKAGGNEKELFGRAKTETIRINPGMNLYNLSIEGHAANDDLAANINWNNFDEKTFSGSLKTLTHFSKKDGQKPHVEVNVLPSTIYFNDSLWTIAESEINIDSTSILFDKFLIKNSSQHILINGKISENAGDKASIKLENIKLPLFSPLFSGTSIDGLLNGYAYVSDFYEKQKLNLDLRVDDLMYQHTQLGDLVIGSNWDNSTEKLRTELYLIKEDSLVIDGTGNISPLENSIDMTFGFHQMPLNILQSLMPSEFNNQKGFANGGLRVSGDFNNLQLNGKVAPSGEASMGLTYLKTVYYTSDTLEFKGNSILFNNMRARDKFGNKGIVSGSIRHTNFSSMDYDLKLKFNKMLVLDTKQSDNDEFYGTGYASGNVSITGHAEDIFLSGPIKTEKDTKINIPIKTSEDAVKHDFIQFKSKSKTEKKSDGYKINTTGLDMNFDVEMTPEAKVQFIINSQLGEIISGYGAGNLNVHVDRKYHIDLYGNYEIEKGDYLFNLQSLINKSFTIEKGGTLKWIGDPYNALIDITATYQVKTSLYHLFAGTTTDFDVTRRIPVNCIIKLEETLEQPQISFQIELPTAEERIKEEVSQMIVTEEDVNKQMISLILLGHFYTPEFLSGQSTSTQTGSQIAESTVGTTVSELFSTQLSRWINKISNTWDIGINYRPGNEISNDQIEFALSTQLLNDRITIDGNIANNSNPTTTNPSSFIGDFDFNMKLTQNGKLQLKAYTHSNDDLTDDTAPNTQGIGFIYREEFNTFRELVQKYVSFIVKKNKKKEAVAVEKQKN